MPTDAARPDGIRSKTIHDPVDRLSALQTRIRDLASDGEPLGEDRFSQVDALLTRGIEHLQGAR